MPIEIVIPALDGDECVLAGWRLEVGQGVRAGEPVADVELDKALIELPAPADGVLAARLAEPEWPLSGGAVVAVLAGDGEDADEIRARYAAATGQPPAADPHPSRDDVLRVAPLRGTRGSVAARVRRSAAIPQFQVTADCDLERFLALRRQLKHDPSTRRVNINAMTLKCVAAALADHPALNATCHGEVIYEHARADINMAVSVPGGVLMPLLRDVGAKSLSDLSEEIDELVRAARHRHIHREDLEVGTFSVSSLGSFGVRDFTALVLPPQVGILAVGTIRQEPMVRGREVVVGPRVALTISVDHRAIDGAVAAEFMQALQKNIVEQPDGVLCG
jgi:pyruvate dehydrogenase E2 component (dihydrolipoamide acetyltransferase)